MKQLQFFIASFFIFALMSCGGAGQEPTDNITWGQAFNHVSGSFTYWLFIIIAGAAAGYGGYVLYKKYKAHDIESLQLVVAAVLLVALNLAVWLIRPSEVAANTTVEQASRGVFIGY